MGKCKGVKIEEKEGKRRKKENRKEKKKCKLTRKRESQRIPWETSVFTKSVEGEELL